LNHSGERFQKDAVSVSGCTGLVIFIKWNIKISFKTSDRESKEDSDDDDDRDNDDDNQEVHLQIT